MQRCALLFLTMCLMPHRAGAQGSSVSYTGSLSTPQSVESFIFTLTATDTVTLKTWGFGGGVNAAGNTIAAGGFDPLLALYTGGSAAASIYVDGSGNPVANADNLLDPPWSIVGNCPPAGTVQVGSHSDCGDLKVTIALAAGTYTLLLTDANYLPMAIYDKTEISDSYLNLTPGALFQMCDPVADACLERNGNYAVDIVSTKSDLVAISKCDINQNTITNAVDAQLMIRQASGLNAPANDLNGNGSVNVVDIQFVIDAALGLGCAAK